MLDDTQTDQTDTDGDTIGDVCDDDDDGDGFTNGLLVAAEFSLDGKAAVGVEMIPYRYANGATSSLNPDYMVFRQTFTSAFAGTVARIEVPIDSCVGPDDGYLYADLYRANKDIDASITPSKKGSKKIYKFAIDTTPSGAPLSFSFDNPQAIEAGEGLELWINSYHILADCKWRGASLGDNASKTAFGGLYNSPATPLTQIDSFGYKVYVRPDVFDNCPFKVNPDQADNDKDDRGDVCDHDDDNDGIYDTQDNCPFVMNISQSNSNIDNMGDLCDHDDDSDGDTFIDFEDNCPSVMNIEQTDDDTDGIGNYCDIDHDDCNDFQSRRDYCR